MNWNKENRNKLRRILQEKYDSLGDEKLWGKFLYDNGIFVMGIEDVAEVWNMEPQRDMVVILDPTIDEDWLKDVFRKAYAPSREELETIRNGLWFTLSKKLAEKIIVLGGVP